MIYEDKLNNIFIKAKDIQIGKDTSFGRNVKITVAGDFSIGDYSRIGDNTIIEGNNISIGKHFYGSGGMIIGAGGQQYPSANLTMGDRCVVHNNVINVCEPVEIGNDVGFSGKVEIITHGFWLSVLEGYPAGFGKVKVGNGVILGFGSTLLMNANIANNIVLGAHSLVLKELTQPNSVYAGAPARFIRKIEPIKNIDEKIRIIEEILYKYSLIATHQNIYPEFHFLYPWINVNNFRCNVETFEFEGIEDNETDNFRDFLRKWGIRIYTCRPFATHYIF